MKIFARGKRGELWLEHIGDRKVLVKKARGDSKAINRVQNEAKWLRKLNRYGIGPRLIKAGDDSFTMEFIDGEHFDKWFRKSRDVGILKDILEQCRTLDKLKVNKYELGRPTKNIIIGKRPVLIDFERCRHDDKPKNVSQFCQFLYRNNFIKDFEVIRKYKKFQTDANFLKILKAF